MSLVAKVRFYLRSLFQKRELNEQLSEEVRTHVEMATEENVAKGMTSDEARYASLREFGNVAGVQERARDERGWVWLEQLGQDLRYAGRQLRRSPGFTVVVVLTLALGIGATTAIFSVVNAVIFNPIGGPEPERLLQIAQREVVMGRTLYQGVCPPVLEAITAVQGEFADLAWSDAVQLERKSDDFIQMESGSYVSPNYFRVLGIQPLLGRGFVSEEAISVVDGVPVEDAPIVVSYDWWRSQWGGHLQIVGHLIEMGGRKFTVVGVMPPHFRFPHWNTKFWLPAEPVRSPEKGVRMAVTKVIVRLKSAGTLPQAQAMVDAIRDRLMSDRPAADPYSGFWRIKAEGLEISVRPLGAVWQDDHGWGQLRQTLLGLFSAIGFVVLIVCANVANLTLARVERRQHELAVRAATGASRGRLMRQLLTENLLLSAVGGAAGLVVAVGGMKLLMALNRMPRLRPVEFDGPLVGVAMGIALLTGILFGLAPMWRGGRVRLNPLLADGGSNSSAGRSRSHVRNALVIGQVAITIVLLAGAGLMLRSVNKMLRLDPGFDPESLLLVDMPFPWRKYDAPKQGATLKAQLLEDVAQRIAALPGVKAVGYQQLMFERGYKFPEREALFTARSVQVGIGSNDVFQTLRTPLLEGRHFLPEDVTQPHHVLINEVMARQLWLGESAVGKQIPDESAPGGAFTVVGVVRDMKADSYIKEVGPEIYHPLQAAWTRIKVMGGMAPQLVIRTGTEPSTLVSAVRRELKTAEPDLLMPTFNTAQGVLFESTLAQRTYRNYLLVFALLGVLLSSLGIYGVLAFSVSRRIREIGIRIAIGADATEVCGMILKQGARLILIGIALGLVVAFGVTRFLQSQLFDVSPTDPITLLAAAVMLGSVGLLASWLPARRAAKVDPVVALRAE